MGLEYKHVQFNASHRDINDFVAEVQEHRHMSLPHYTTEGSRLWFRGATFDGLLKLTEDSDHVMPTFSEGKGVMRRLVDFRNVHVHDVDSALCKIATATEFSVSNLQIVKARLYEIGDVTDTKMTYGWTEHWGPTKHLFGATATYEGSVESIVRLHNKFRDQGIFNLDSISLSFNYK